MPATSPRGGHEVTCAAKKTQKKKSNAHERPKAFSPQASPNGPVRDTNLIFLPSANTDRGNGQAFHSGGARISQRPRKRPRRTGKRVRPARPTGQHDGWTIARFPTLPSFRTGVIHECNHSCRLVLPALLSNVVNHPETGRFSTVSDRRRQFAALPADRADRVETVNLPCPAAWPDQRSLGTSGPLAQGAIPVGQIENFVRGSSWACGR